MPPMYEIEAGLTRSNATKLFPDTQKGHRDVLDAGLLHAVERTIDVTVVQFSPRTDGEVVLFRYEWDANILRSEPENIPWLAQEKPDTTETIPEDPFAEFAGCIAG